MDIQHRKFHKIVICDRYTGPNPKKIHIWVKHSVSHQQQKNVRWSEVKKCDFDIRKSMLSNSEKSLHFFTHFQI